MSLQHHIWKVLLTNEMPESLTKHITVVVFSVVRDRVIAFWFRDKLALAFGIAVSTMGLGSVLTFLFTSNMAQWIGLTETLFVGMLFLVSITFFSVFFSSIFFCLLFMRLRFKRFHVRLSQGLSTGV